MKSKKNELRDNLFKAIRDYLVFCGWTNWPEVDNDFGAVIDPIQGRKCTIDYALMIQWQRDKAQYLPEEIKNPVKNLPDKETLIQAVKRHMAASTKQIIELYSQTSSEEAVKSNLKGIFGEREKTEEK